MDRCSVCNYACKMMTSLKAKGRLKDANIKPKGWTIWNVSQTWNLSKSLHTLDFLRKFLTQKWVNLNERKIATKQRKWWLKFNKVNLLWVYLVSIRISCVNNPSAACKVVEALYLYCKLTLVNSTPSICTQTRQNCDKNSVCLPKDFTPTNWILHRHACGACDKFHVCLFIFDLKTLLLFCDWKNT